MRGVKGELRGLDRVATRGLGNAANNLGRMALVAGGAAVAGLGYAVKAAGDFEAQLNTINTVAQLTPPELAKIGDSIRAMSRDTGIATEELTAGYYDLVSAGISATNAQDVLNQSVKLGIGGLGTTGEAIDLLTTAVNAYGGDASKAGLYADYFAQAVAAGKVTVSDIASSFANAAPLAAALGVGVDELAASYAQMTAAGIKPAETMTAVQAAMLALQRTTPAVEKLQKRLNVSFAEMAGEKGLAYTWNLIAAEAKKAGIPLIEYTGRQEALAFVLNTSGENAAGYNRQLELVRESHDGAGVAAAQMAQRQKGFNHQISRLKANLHDAAITIGTALLPKLADLAEKATGWLAGHQGDVERFAEDLARGFQGAVDWASRLDWATIGQTLSTVAGVGRTILETFLKMPAWVQTAVVTGWGLNKLTGGALGTIVNSLAGGLIKGVLGINAGVVNINAGMVSGGPGGVIGAAGKAGTGLVILRFLGLAGAAALGAVLGKEIGHAMFFDPTVKPAVDYESRVVAGVAASGSAAKIEHAISEVAKNLAYLEGPDAGTKAIAEFLYGDQLAVLREQLAGLREQLAKINAANAANSARWTGLWESTRASTAESARWAGLAKHDLSTIASGDRKRAEQAEALKARVIELAGPLRGLLGKNWSPTINVYPRFTASVVVNYNARRMAAAQARINLAAHAQEF